MFRRTISAALIHSIPQASTPRASAYQNRCAPFRRNIVRSRLRSLAVLPLSAHTFRWTLTLPSATSLETYLLEGQYGLAAMARPDAPTCTLRTLPSGFGRCFFSLLISFQ